MYRFNIFIDLKSEEDMMHNLFSFNLFSYLFVIMQLKHINDNLCLSDHTIVNPFPHANTQNLDAIPYTNRSDRNLNVSLDQSCLTPR